MGFGRAKGPDLGVLEADLGIWEGQRSLFGRLVADFGVLEVDFAHKTIAGSTDS